MYEGIKHLMFQTTSAECQKDFEKGTFPSGVTKYLGHQNDFQCGYLWKRKNWNNWENSLMGICGQPWSSLKCFMSSSFAFQLKDKRLYEMSVLRGRVKELKNYVFWACLETKNTDLFVSFDLLSTCGLLTTYTQTKENQFLCLIKVGGCDLFVS